jgi:hypothetical protein
MSIDIKNVACNWVIVPGPGSSQPDKNQKWLMTLTGLADINFSGDYTNENRSEDFLLYLDFRSPLKYAYGQIPSGYELLFRPEQWAPFATINSIYIRGDDWAGAYVGSCKLLLDGSRNFLGLTFPVNLYGPRTYFNNVGFQVTMLGRIILSTIPT